MEELVLVVAGTWDASGVAGWEFVVSRDCMARIVFIDQATTFEQLKWNIEQEFVNDGRTTGSNIVISFWPPAQITMLDQGQTPPVELKCNFDLATFRLMRTVVTNMNLFVTLVPRQVDNNQLVFLDEAMEDEQSGTHSQTVDMPPLLDNAIRLYDSTLSFSGEGSSGVNPAVMGTYIGQTLDTQDTDYSSDVMGTYVAQTQLIQTTAGMIDLNYRADEEAIGFELDDAMEDMILHEEYVQESRKVRRSVRRKLFIDSDTSESERGQAFGSVEEDVAFLQQVDEAEAKAMCAATANEIRKLDMQNKGKAKMVEEEAPGDSYVAVSEEDCSEDSEDYMYNELQAYIVPDASQFPVVTKMEIGEGSTQPELASVEDIGAAEITVSTPAVGPPFDAEEAANLLQAISLSR